MIIAAHGDPPPSDAIVAAGDALGAGQIVGIPTDTVYGIAARFDDADATTALFRAKARPPDLELPVLVGTAEQAEALGEFGEAHSVAVGPKDEIYVADPAKPALHKVVKR